MSDSPVAADAVRETPRAPKENLVRAASSGVTLRAVVAPADDQAASENANGMPTLYGHFTPFNTWTEIDSMWEGNFMERVDPKAFNKTFRERTPLVLFQHGGDPQVGDKPLGAPSVLRADEIGPYYEVPMLDTSYNRDIIPGLEAGLYGASFRFSVVREEWNDDPGASDDNPKGLPERTIKELRCMEFGPVSFPAYPDATAGVRSMTDEFLIARATSQPDTLRSILDYLDKRETRPDARILADMVSSEIGARSDLTPATEPDSETSPAERSAEDTEAPGATPTPLTTDDGAPVKTTPLFGQKGSRSATPGPSPTSLYTGKSKKNRKGWAL